MLIETHNYTENDKSRIMVSFGQIRDRLAVILCDKHERIVPDIMPISTNVQTIYHDNYHKTQKLFTTVVFV